MKKPKIIVVVPAYNEERHIGQFIAALRAGSRQPDYIVLVDNNSSDKTVEIARSFPRIKIISGARQGICYAVTTGYQTAYDMHADIVCRSDADARPATDWLYTVERLFNDNPAVVAVTGSQTVYDASSLERYYCLFLDRFIAYSSRLLMRGTIFLRGTNVAFRANVWPQCKKHLLCREDLIHEDMDVSMAMARAGKLFYEPSMRMPVARRTFIKPAPQAIGYVRRWLRVAGFAWRGRY